MAPGSGSDSFFNDESNGMAREYAKLDGPAARMAGLPALELIKHSGVLDALGPLNILDNAAGPALIAGFIYDQLSSQQPSKLDDLHITCGDINAAMVQAAQAKIDTGGWKNVEALRLDQNDLSSLEDNSFTHVLTGLGINVSKDPESTLGAMARILKPGGVCAFSIFEKVGWTAYVKEAFERVPGAPTFPDQETGFAMIQHGNPWQKAEWTKNATGMHFTKVQQFRRDVEHRFTVDEFVSIFAGPMIIAMLGVFWPAEDQAKYGSKLAPALREMLLEKKKDHVEIQMVVTITVAIKK